jgi:hypothetical protein
VTHDDLPNYVTLDYLKAHGITCEDVRRYCPHAVENVALDGSPCWRAEDLEALVSRARGRYLP